jgi:hypothetical protein
MRRKPLLNRHEEYVNSNRAQRFVIRKVSDGRLAFRGALRLSRKAEVD